MKTCSVCKIDKPYSEYHKDKTARPNGYKSGCKACVLSKQKGRTRQRTSAQLKHYYGITIEDWELMFANQHGKCAANPKHQLLPGRGTHVDHDHKTGKVRALLCSHCNRALGGVMDDIETLTLLIQYLKHHTEAPATRGVSHKNSETAA